MTLGGGGGGPVRRSSAGCAVVGGWRRWWGTGLKLFSRRDPSARPVNAKYERNSIAAPPPGRCENRQRRPQGRRRRRHRAARFSLGRGDGGRGEKRMTRRECVRSAYREQPATCIISLLFSFYHRTYAAVIHTAVTHAAVPVSGCVGRNRGETGAGAGSERECVREGENSSECERRRRRLLRGPCAVRPRNPDTNV